MSDTELSAFLLAGVFDVCERDGVSAKDVLAAGGTTREIVEVSGATVLRSKAVAMFGALAEASAQPDAAFRAGLCLPIERSPDLVRLFRSAPDLPALVAPLNAALGSVCGGLIGVSVSKDCARLGLRATMRRSMGATCSNRPYSNSSSRLNGMGVDMISAP